MVAPRAGRPKGRVLFVGHSYYHAWYLSRELRKLGWKADVLNWDVVPENQVFYHGDDFHYAHADGRLATLEQALSYARALPRYDIFHFSNILGLRFGERLHGAVARRFGEYSEIRLLRRLGKKVVYSVSSCNDGVLQSSFAAWGPHSTCADCQSRLKPWRCSDQHNRLWGEARNSVSDYIVTAGGNRVDFNDDPLVHEVPEFYCLDEDVWRPDLEIPPTYRLPPTSAVRLYHSVGNGAARIEAGTNRSIKSTHIYLPLVDQLRDEGHDVELLYFTNVPNQEVRFYQAQADVVCEMLTFGWFGANARESLMLGKPVVCYLRPEWIEMVRKEVPGYVEELPVVSATPETVHDVLAELIEDAGKRRELGEAGREFALKWHSARAGARRFDEIYSELIES